MGNCPLRPSSLLQWPGEEGRKSSKVSNMFQSWKCAILPAALWASVMSTAVDSVSVSITSRPRRLGGNEDFVLPLISCHILHFLLLSAAHEIMKLSARKTIKISLIVNMKFVFIWQHQLLHQVRSQRQQRAVCVFLEWITAALFTCPLYRSSLAVGRTRTFPSGLFGSVGTLRKNKSYKSWSLIILSVMFSICVRAVIGVFPVSVWCDTCSFSSPWKQRLCFW